MPKIFIKIGLSVFAFLFFLNGKAQETKTKSEIIQLTGRIVSQIEKQPLAFATVINTHLLSGTMSDTMGLFYIEVLKTDTIRISTIGYKKCFFSLKDSVIKENTIHVDLFLEREIYELAAIDVRALSWKQFKYQIINMDVPVDPRPDVDEWIKTLFTPYELAALASNRNPGGIAIPFSLPNKKDKSRKKVMMLERQAEIDRIIDEKYNPSIVQKNTSLDGDELIDFMLWCNFDRVWLLRTNHYTIIMEIRRLFDIYQKQKR